MTTSIATRIPDNNTFINFDRKIPVSFFEGKIVVVVVVAEVAVSSFDCISGNASDQTVAHVIDRNSDTSPVLLQTYRFNIKNNRTCIFSLFDDRVK